MALPKYATALGIVILVVLLIALAISLVTNPMEVVPSTVSMNDVKEKIGTGSFVYIQKGGNVTRITIQSQNNYLFERITQAGDLIHQQGKFTIHTINSLQDPLYILVRSHPGASPGANNNYTQLSGTFYITFEKSSSTYLLDDKNKSYELWTKGGPILAVPTGEADYEIFVFEAKGQSIAYNGTIRVLSKGNISSTVTAEAPHVHMVTGKSISAVFQKVGDDNNEMIVILFDPVAHKIVSRATTNKPYGSISLTS
jgi:hypothetical protein